MSKSTLAIFILLLTLSMPLVTAQAITIAPPEPRPTALSTDIVRNWTIRIVLVNYNQLVIDPNILVMGLPVEINYMSDPSITHRYQYDVTFANASYVESLKSVILAHSTTGDTLGTRLNESALEYQKAHLDEPQRIFYPRAGREIDAYAVEDWLLEHPAVESPDLGYTFYLFNFSEFDSADHSFEHWYNYHPVDPDTGNTQDWFRLEWDNELNQHVKFEYAGFGGRKGNIYVLDASADQWYFRWARIWWGESPYTDQPEYCTMDLEDKLTSVNMSTSEGIDAFNQYLHRYMYDPISYLLAPSQHSPTKYVSSGLLRALVFAMDVNDGISVDSLRWVTNAERQKEHLQELLPFIDWKVQVDFLDIEQESDWKTLFWNHASLDSNNKTIVDGQNMFIAIYNQMRPNYVDTTSENINVFGVVFIKKNMEMHVYGRTYTGLGGNGQTVIWKSWERYYRPDGVTPKDGISSVQLHESMHAIGMAHTWEHSHYAGDFSYGPMGYFAFHNGTATYDQDFVQSTFLDQMQSKVIVSYLDALTQLKPNPREETLYAKSMVLANINLAITHYNHMNWIECYNALGIAQTWIERMIYSDSDTTPPTIDAWGITDSNNATYLDVWAQVSGGLSAIDNVTVHVLIDNASELVYLCSRHYTNWTATVPVPEYNDHLLVWIEAWDMGMNHAKSDAITISLSTTSSNPPLMPLPMPYIIIGGIAFLCVVLILVYRKQHAV